MEKLLTLVDKKNLAIKYGIDPKALLAVVAVEASGSGFNRDGSIKIQFEPHWFKKYTKIQLPNGVEGQKEEYLALNKALPINEEAAYLSTSWGLGQIMGFNFKTAGYKSAKEMAEAFKISEYNQLEGMIRHILSNKHLTEALKTLNWDVFAYFYNGKDYLKFDYANRLATAYKK